MSANLQIEQELTSELAQGRHLPRNLSLWRISVRGKPMVLDPGHPPGQDPARNLMLMFQILLTGGSLRPTPRPGRPKWLTLPEEGPAPCEPSAFHLI